MYIWNKFLCNTYIKLVTDHIHLFIIHIYVYILLPNCFYTKLFLQDEKGYWHDPNKEVQRDPDKEKEHDLDKQREHDPDKETEKDSGSKKKKKRRKTMKIDDPQKVTPLWS